MDKKYVINTDSLRLIEDEGNLGASFRKSPYLPATQSEIAIHELSESKKEIRMAHETSIPVKDLIESLIEHISNGTPLDQKTKDWATRRKTLRDQGQID